MSKLIFACVVAVLVSVGHTVLIGWLTRQMVVPVGARTVSRSWLPLLQPLLRLCLATLALLSFWEGGAVAGVVALTGFWLGRMIVLIAVWRSDPG